MAAHYVVVEGVRLPAKVGGHPALDFCNTLSGWDGKDRWDYLQTYEHLAIWCAFAGLLPVARVATLRRQAQRHTCAATTALQRAEDFRARLYDVLRSGPRAPAFDLLAEDVEGALTRLRLRRSGRTIDWEIESASDLAAPVDAVAWSAGGLLTSAELALVRACPGPGCGWLFLDRRRRRRWCTMATCGNRAKAKRFASRHQPGGED